MSEIRKEEEQDFSKVVVEAVSAIAGHTLMLLALCFWIAVALLALTFAVGVVMFLGRVLLRTIGFDVSLDPWD